MNFDINMKITSQNAIVNFCSIYKGQTSVLKRNKDIAYKYVPETVQIVEFDPSNFDDKLTISNLIKHWENNEEYGAYYAQGIQYNFENIEIERHKNVNPRFFAIEKQEPDNEEYKNILCITQYNDKNFANNNKIKWLQVHPNYLYENEFSERMYKGIGTQMVEYLKSLSNKPLEVFSATDAIDFYKKLGFKQTFNTSQTYLVYG